MNKFKLYGTIALLLVLAGGLFNFLTGVKKHDYLPAESGTLTVKTGADTARIADSTERDWLRVERWIRETSIKENERRQKN